MRIVVCNVTQRSGGRETRQEYKLVQVTTISVWSAETGAGYGQYKRRYGGVPAHAFWPLGCVPIGYWMEFGATIITLVKAVNNRSM